MKNIHWLAPCRIQGLEQIKNLSLASIRLRAGALLSAMDRSQCKLTLGESVPDKAGICIVGKIGSTDVARRSVAWMEQIKRHKALGRRVVLDYTDDHLAVDTSMSPFYRDCVEHADLCVCSSTTLKQSLGEYFQGRIEVIPDAVEVVSRLPKAATNNPVTLLWFGRASNLGYLVDFLPALAMQRMLNLLLLTDIEGMHWLQSSRMSVLSNLRIQFGAWDKAAMEQAAAISDVCIIPSDPDDPRKAGVSSNRLITALALGLPTGADLMASYVDYKPYFANIRSIEFHDMLENPAAWRERVVEAQQTEVGRHEMTRIGLLWCRLLDIITQKSPAL